MADDSVEREILIEATPEIVWGVITEASQISRWLSDEAELESRVGGNGMLTWCPGGRGGEKERAALVPIRVVEAEPFHRFSFRWNHPQGTEPDQHNSALVEFSLTEEAGGTRLRVLESGIGAVTDDEAGRSRYREEHDRGWQRHLGEMRGYVTSERREAAH